MRAKVLAESEVKTKSEKGDGEGNKWIVQMLFNNICSSFCRTSAIMFGALKPGLAALSPSTSLI